MPTGNFEIGTVKTNIIGFEYHSTANIIILLHRITYLTINNLKI